MTSGEYRDGWIPRITPTGIEWEQFHRVRVRPGPRSDIVEICGRCPKCRGETWTLLTIAETVAHCLEIARIQRHDFASDPPRVRSLLGVDGYLADAQNYNSRDAIGRLAAFLHTLWERMNGR